MRKNKLVFLMMFAVAFILLLVGCFKDNPIDNNGNKNGNEEKDKPIDTSKKELFDKTYLDFDGGGMEFNIFIEALSVDRLNSSSSYLFDPFAKNYTSSDKTEKQAYHRAIEAKYNVKINYIYASDFYEKYPCFLNDNMLTIELYKYHHSEENLKYVHGDEKCPLEEKFKNTYAVINDTLLKPETYGNYDVLRINGCNGVVPVYNRYNFLEDKYVELYDIKNDSGLFKEIGREFNNLNIELGSYFGKTYTYIPQQVFNTNFLVCKEDASILNDKNPVLSSYLSEIAIDYSNDANFEFKVADILSNSDFNTSLNMFDLSNDTVRSIYNKLPLLYKSVNINDTNCKDILLNLEFGSDRYHDYGFTKALKLPSSSEYNYVNSAPGYSFLNFEKLENGFNSEIAFKIIYELEEGYRLKATTSDLDKFKEKLEKFLDNDSVKLILDNQNNLKFLPYYKLLANLYFIKYDGFGELKVNNLTKLEDIKNEFKFKNSKTSEVQEESVNYFEFLNIYNKLIFETK